jgi:hypothetical protein
MDTVKMAHNAGVALVAEKVFNSLIDIRLVNPA